MTSAKPGIVLDVGGDGELAARLDALDQDRLQHGARGIDGGGVAGGAGADDDDLGVGSFGHSGLLAEQITWMHAAAAEDAGIGLFARKFKRFGRAMQDYATLIPTTSVERHRSANARSGSRNFISRVGRNIG